MFGNSVPRSRDNPPERCIAALSMQAAFGMAGCTTTPEGAAQSDHFLADKSRDGSLSDISASKNAAGRPAFDGHHFNRYLATQAHYPDHGSRSGPCGKGPVSTSLPGTV